MLIKHTVYFSASTVSIRRSHYFIPWINLLYVVPMLSNIIFIMNFMKLENCHHTPARLRFRRLLLVSLPSLPLLSSRLGRRHFFIVSSYSSSSFVVL